MIVAPQERSRKVGCPGSHLRLLTRPGWRMVRAMPTTFVKGDLFHTAGIRAYAQGCNCAGTMDAGVGVAFKKRWPGMFEEYRLRCGDGRFHLGDVFVWNDRDPRCAIGRLMIDGMMNASKGSSMVPVTIVGADT